MPRVISVEKWHELGVKLRDVGYFLMSECKVEPTNKGVADPLVMAVCVLARTISNLRAVLDLVGNGHIVEARAIARCCFENSFWMQAILAGGDEFVREMRRDEAASMKSRLELIFAKVGKLDDQTQEKSLRDRLQEDKKLGLKPLNPKDTAGRGPLENSYLIYRQLSADAAHPSISSLMRYLVRTYEDNQTVYTVTAVPDSGPGEARITLEWACGAAVAVYVGVNQIFQGTPAGGLVAQAADELAEMAGFAQLPVRTS